MIDRYDLLMNPALGSIAIASLSNGYCQSKGSIPFILLFFAIPMTFQKEIRETILSSRSFPSLIAKLKRDNKDQLIRIHKNIIALKMLSLKSIAVAESAGFLTIQSKEGTIKSCGNCSIPPGFNNSIVSQINRASVQIGKIFTQIDIKTIFNYLNVEP